MVTVSSGARPGLSGHRRRLRPVHLAENKALSLLHPAVCVPDSPTLIARTAKFLEAPKAPPPPLNISPQKPPPWPHDCHCPQTLPFLTTVGSEGFRQTVCHGSRDGHIAHTRFPVRGKMAHTRFSGCGKNGKVYKRNAVVCGSHLRTCLQFLMFGWI